MSLGAPHDHDCQCVRCQSRRKPTPLQIATQEYAYWRSFDLKECTEKAPETFNAVLVGAIGAAANIASRLAGHEFAGIDYQSLSPDQITKTLMEIRLAPRMAQVLVSIESLVKFWAEREINAPSNSQEAVRETYEKLRAFEGVLADLKKAGTL